MLYPIFNLMEYSMQVTSFESDIAPAIPANAMALLQDMLGLDDPEFLVDLIGTYLDDSTNLVRALRAEWVIGNREVVLRSAHSLKSASATFHATRLSTMASELEEELRDNAGEVDVHAQIQRIVDEHARVSAALAIERDKMSV